MTDVVTKGNAAKRILEDQVFKDATTEYSKQLVHSWEYAETTFRREELHQQMTALKAVVNNLAGFMNNGEYELKTSKKEGWFK